MSLPLPGWTWLYELDDRTVRKLAHDVYQGTHFGDGLNLRSGATTPLLSVLSTEAIVRTHVHVKSYRRDGTFDLSPQQRAKRTEMLLAGHAVVGAACLGHALLRGFAGEGPLALRHVNMPVLARIGFLAARMRADVRQREHLRPRTWEDLLPASTNPQMLDDALQLDELAEQFTAN